MEDDEESQVIRQLRKAIRELPLGELNKLKRDGIKGEPLHRALGFSNEEKLKTWLISREADEESEDVDVSESDDDSDAGEEEESSKSATKKTKETAKRLK